MMQDDCDDGIIMESCNESVIEVVSDTDIQVI